MFRGADRLSPGGGARSVASSCHMDPLEASSVGISKACAERRLKSSDPTGSAILAPGGRKPRSSGTWGCVAPGSTAVMTEVEDGAIGRRLVVGASVLSVVPTVRFRAAPGTPEAASGGRGFFKADTRSPSSFLRGER